ncbi:hypothetical protein [uncultured Draconibacterium sp.]|uniref:hypothetical protein n=1 Tax=uncultured Draconibacterium sp. TaxID=1573823 RepID=UPI003217A4DD
MTNRFPLIVIVIIIGIFQFSCTKEDFTFNPKAKLEFSLDTLAFDTVFTSIGSTTKRFTVKNPNKQAVNISKIYLAGKNSTPFRLNINGLAANEDNDVNISGGDSIYVFVEVTINPTGQNLPMVVHDSIVFNLNGNTQDVDLIAFGQDFHLFDGEILKTQTWKNDKPYLIYNSVLIDSLETLTILEGCRIHFHKGSSMFVRGTLDAKGTIDEPIKFLGDRLEKSYEDVPGQWGAFAVLENGGIYIYGGLHFLVGSINNTIDWAIVKNADKGIQVDSLGVCSNPVLTLTNSRIENMTLNCLDARTTYLKAANSVFANSGSNTVALRFGGDYEFIHCTIANYFNIETRKEPTLVLNNYYEYKNQIFSFNYSSNFCNCIVYGSINDEIYIDKKGDGTFKSDFKNCLLNADPDLESDFENSIFNKNPIFTDVYKYNYTLDYQSPAKDIGDIEIAKLFPLDLNNNSRLEDSGPDLGAYEWLPKTEEED